MKMEVLSVQNSFNSLGSAKVKARSDFANGSNSFDLSAMTVDSNWTAPISTSASPSPTHQIESPTIEHEDALHVLAMRLQSELKTAKSEHLACTEVLLPADLLRRVSTDMINLSEKEPCGIRGSSIFIEFEDEPGNTRRIGSFKTDPRTVSTFELYLTLKQDRSSWTSSLPQFLKNLTRNTTIMINPDYSLTKHKLYHSSTD